MLRYRVIPILLLKDGDLVKGSRFKKHRYIGDPVNTVKIFNEKEVDEIVILDISRSIHQLGPDFDLIEEICSEAFMPFAYGGGIRTFEDAKMLFQLGVEKVIINTAFHENPELVSDIAKVYGSQSVVVSLDVRKRFGGYQVRALNGTRKIKKSIIDCVIDAEHYGAGEIIITSINSEGTREGYDIQLYQSVVDKVSIPIVASGGADSVSDFADIIRNSGVSAVSAGSMFVFYGKRSAVLVTYPHYKSLEAELNHIR